ncbi:aminopeptidase P family protein [Streptococcus cuniculipharyngis]|uniref:Aminopeptidase P family protein n=1 Tax=Streptococcus cuniculipharyngis TaxID=1562651 RepID=A0A5C5SH08_9STRE|nr:Xaa-Pro peptidase family protein [Streptococcus cuniculipharyngis]TWS99225.1 aminopeptidase P family protein [Streptococcus cuniculipharyngis]
MTKLDTIAKLLQEQEADLAILSNPMTINYLTGYFCDPHERLLFLFVFPNREPLLFLPELDLLRAKTQLNVSLIAYADDENPWQKIKSSLPKQAFDQLLVEFDHLNLSKYQGLTDIFSGHFENITPTINQMKLIKTADEIDKMLVAGQFADRAMQVGFDQISLTTTETDIIAQIEFAMKREGIPKMSFETMVLTGKNAANPHGIPGKNQLENNSLLLFDLGVETLGYTSDMTRTVALGQPDQFKKDIYQLCLEAQLTALDMIKPGVTAAEIDQAARSVIEKAGYGDFFNHRLGHGIGMEVHEFPSIMAGNDLVIQEGMCFSVEPGIYIPDKVGVRIEDCGYVTKHGFKLFTQTSKDLLYF